MARLSKAHAPLIERVMRAISKTSANCWEWQGKLNNNGYGQIGAGGRGGVDLLVHRVTYEHFVGPIPSGLDLDHTCRNRCCCNPKHLEPKTRLANLLCGAHPNMVTKRTGICSRGHHISGVNELRGKDGRIRCRACTNERRRSYWAAAAARKRASEEPAIREDRGDYVWRGVSS